MKTPKSPRRAASAVRVQRVVRALRRARGYLVDVSPLLDGPNEWSNPESGVGSVVAYIDDALRPNCKVSDPATR